MKKAILVLIVPAVFYSLAAQSDEVIMDDLIVLGGAANSSASLCVGDACIDGEIFDFDSVKLKTNDPTIKFEDTSSSGSFPTNDWVMGITDNAAPGPAQFFINDFSGATSVLLMEAGLNGGIAMGAGSTLEDGAISVGSTGFERRIVNVADGIADTDAATTGQFNTFSDSINTNFAAELVADRAELDAQLATLQDRIDSLSSRLDAVIAQLNK
jgi:hypothetical protein